MRILAAAAVLACALLTGCGRGLARLNGATPDYTVVARNIYIQPGAAGGRAPGYYVTIVVGGIGRETYLGDYFATGYDGTANGNPCFEKAKIGTIFPPECR
ncbi:MAG: hypothetical protein WC273_01880 [Dehalococcoidia bacterium]